MENELLYNELYEKTQDCGRAQFVKLLMEKERENQQLKSKLEASEKARNKCSSRIKTLGKFDGETCTRSLKLWKADFNELINILDIDKGE